MFCLCSIVMCGCVLMLMCCFCFFCVCDMGVFWYGDVIFLLRLKVSFGFRFGVVKLCVIVCFWLVLFGLLCSFCMVWVIDYQVLNSVFQCYLIRFLFCSDICIIGVVVGCVMCCVYLVSVWCLIRLVNVVWFFLVICIIVLSFLLNRLWNGLLFQVFRVMFMFRCEVKVILYSVVNVLLLLWLWQVSSRLVWCVLWISLKNVCRCCGLFRFGMVLVNVGSVLWLVCIWVRIDLFRCCLLVFRLISYSLLLVLWFSSGVSWVVVLVIGVNVEIISEIGEIDLCVVLVLCYCVCMDSEFLLIGMFRFSCGYSFMFIVCMVLYSSVFLLLWLVVVIQLVDSFIVFSVFIGVVYRLVMVLFIVMCVDVVVFSSVSGVCLLIVIVLLVMVLNLVRVMVMLVSGSCYGLIICLCVVRLLMLWLLMVIRKFLDVIDGCVSMCRLVLCRFSLVVFSVGQCGGVG